MQKLCKEEIGKKRGNDRLYSSAFFHDLCGWDRTGIKGDQQIPTITEIIDEEANVQEKYQKKNTTTSCKKKKEIEVNKWHLQHVRARRCAQIKKKTAESIKGISQKQTPIQKPILTYTIAQMQRSVMKKNNTLSLYQLIQKQREKKLKGTIISKGFPVQREGKKVKNLQKPDKKIRQLFDDEKIVNNGILVTSPFKINKTMSQYFARKIRSKDYDHLK